MATLVDTAVVQIKNKKKDKDTTTEVQNNEC